MARPRIDRYFEIDAFLIAKAHAVAKNSVEPTTAILRRVVEGVWAGDPEYVAVIAGFLPSDRPTLEEIQALIGAGAGPDSIVPRLARRLNPEKFRSQRRNGDAMEILEASHSRSFFETPDGSPEFHFDSRRGRRRV